MRSWEWHISEDTDRFPGITWIELQIALLLDDAFVTLLMQSMQNRGWPGPQQEKADPMLVFKTLKSEIRSTLTRTTHNALRDMGTRRPRFKGWGLNGGLACLTGAPNWTEELQEQVKWTIIMAHVDNDEDRQRTRDNIRIKMRQFTVNKLGKWLTNRAGPGTDQILRSLVAAPTQVLPAPRHMQNRGTRKEDSGKGSAICNDSHHPRIDVIRHLYHGANWTCPKCRRHFCGDIGVRPPCAAPPRWCRGCKSTQRLSQAICVSCDNTWNCCKCYKMQDSKLKMLGVANLCTHRDMDMPVTGGSQMDPQETMQTAAACGEVGARAQSCELTAHPEFSVPDAAGTRHGMEGRGVGDTPRTLSTGNPSGGRIKQRPDRSTLVQQTICRYGTNAIYWERQTEGAMCGVHAINCLLQRNAVDGAYMHAVAAEIDQREQELLDAAPGRHEDGNAKPHGDFTIQVIQEALRRLDGGWDLTDTRNPAVREHVRAQPQNEVGYLVNPGGHWYALRCIKRGAARGWYHLDSLNENGPQQLHDMDLLRVIMDIEAAGGTVYTARCHHFRVEAAPQCPTVADVASSGGHASTMERWVGCAPLKGQALKIATDFSGMDMTGYALRQARVHFRHLFASEASPSIREHIRRNHEVETLYECVTKRPVGPYTRPGWNGDGGEEIDIYVAGPPCQPWSRNSANAQGENDPRGGLFQESITFITTAQPRAFVLENVCGLISWNGGRHLSRILEALRNGGYKVRWARLNPLEMGLPQNRPRLYVWGVRNDIAPDAPRVSTDCRAGVLKLRDILGQGEPMDPAYWHRVDGLLPAAAAACVKNVAQRQDTLRKAGEDWVIDEQISRARQGTRKATAHFPCLLHTRKCPPWIGSRVRRASLAEACRAQGLLPAMIHKDDWNKPAELTQLLGNTMAANVLTEVLLTLVRIVQPGREVVNPWETGYMQTLLRQSAMAEDAHTGIKATMTAGAAADGASCDVATECGDVTGRCTSAVAAASTRCHQANGLILAGRAPAVEATTAGLTLNSGRGNCRDPFSVRPSA